VIVDLTVGVLATGSYAGVPAVVVEACEVTGALPVVLALALPAGDEGVSLVARWTPALCGVSSGDALSVGTTGVRIAGVGLLPAASDGVRGGDVAWQTLTHRVTLEVDTAVGVGAAGGGEAGVRGGSPSLYLDTAGDGVRLGGVARQAGAHGVTLSVLCALSVGTAGTGGTRVWSGGTPVVITDIAGAAVKVHLTFSLAAGDSVRHGDVASQAPADGVTLHVLHTHCVGPAGRGLAGVRSRHTSLALTDGVKLTVGVLHTLRSTPSDRVRLGDQAGLTATDGVTSKVEGADSSWAARRGDTRVWLLHTVLVLTDKSSETVGVHQALRSAACDGVRVRYEARQAATDGVTRPGQRTLGPGTTRGGNTGVRLLHTLLVLTDETSAAVRVNDTLWPAASDGVRVRDEAGLTPADGVTRPSHGALSSGATRRGVAGVRLDNTPLALTDVTSLTVGVLDTLRSTASDGVRLGNEARLTGTDGIACIVNITLSPGAAGVGLTRVGLLGTSVGSADKTHPAVRVNDTLWAAASDSIRVGSVARDTATLRVPVPVR